MADIFDEIIQCIRQEQSANGTVYVSRDHLVEFYKNTAPAMQAQPAMQTRQYVQPSAPSRPPQQPYRQESRPVFQDSFRDGPDAEPERAYSPVDLAEIAAMDWSQLKAATSNCHACRLCETRHNVVFADGSEHAELMFIGEGPGADEDAQGVPFVGRAGQLLTRMIAAMQFKRSEVYIANIVKCRPPGNRNPADDEMDSCLPYLNRQIQLVSPKVIVLLGNVALKGLMKRGGISRLRGHWLDYKGIMVMPTFHPAYLLRYEAAKRDAWSDLQQVMKVFGKVYPPHRNQE